MKHVHPSGGRASFAATIEFVTRGGVGARNDGPLFASDPTWNNPQQVNDSLEFARQIEAVVAGQIVSGLTFNLGDTGDWYVLKTPVALKRFGGAQAAFLMKSLITITFANNGMNALFNSANHLFLFAALDTNPGEALSIEPVEFFQGVPKYYLRTS